MLIVKSVYSTFAFEKKMDRYKTLGCSYFLLLLEKYYSIELWFPIFLKHLNILSNFSFCLPWEQIENIGKFIWRFKVDAKTLMDYRAKIWTKKETQKVELHICDCFPLEVSVDFRRGNWESEKSSPLTQT